MPYTRKHESNFQILYITHHIQIISYHIIAAIFELHKKRLRIKCCACENFPGHRCHGGCFIIWKRPRTDLLGLFPTLTGKMDTKYIATKAIIYIYIYLNMYIYIYTYRYIDTNVDIWTLHNFAMHYYSRRLTWCRWYNDCPKLLPRDPLRSSTGGTQPYTSVPALVAALPPMVQVPFAPKSSGTMKPCGAKYLSRSVSRAREMPRIQGVFHDVSGHYLSGKPGMFHWSSWYPIDLNCIQVVVQTCGVAVDEKLSLPGSSSLSPVARRIVARSCSCLHFP